MRVGSRWSASTVAAVAAAIVIVPAPASAKQRVNSFEGSCSMQGVARFSPPATNDLQSLDVRYHATGTCSGSLNGRAITNAPVEVHQAVNDVNGSCPRADTTEPGQGRIAFADGTTIAYSFEFHFPTAIGTFTYRGQRSGTARGAGNLLTPRTPPDVALRCAGEGVSETPLDIVLATDSPLVSKQRTDQAGPGGGPKQGLQGRQIIGTAGDDVLVGTPSPDRITCGAGHDRVRAGAGNDEIDCGSGNDVVAAGAGKDEVHGGSGNDRLEGGSGDDSLFGESGDDALAGDAGDDRLDGGPGDNRRLDDRGGEQSGGDQRASTFTGSCEFVGVVVFRPPLTNTPRSISQRVRAPGTCSGKFIDRSGRTHQLSNAPATFTESSRADAASCTGGTATGRGALRFQHGQIRFTFSETRASGAAAVSATGAKSGSAHGVATVSDSEDPAAIAQQCAGSGLKQVTIEGRLATAPSISG